MGIYNHIHDVDDDYYYYCPRNDCPCHQPDYYDSSRNLNLVYIDDYKYNNYKYDGGFTGELN
jgi:hypothetical protein